MCLLMPKSNQKLIYVSLIAVTLICVAPASSAHTVNPHELGMAHVFSSLTHIVLLALFGSLAAILAATRKRTLIYTANIAVFCLLSWQTYLHMENRDALVGLEFFIAGALISLSTWQITNLVIFRFFRTLRASNLFPHYMLNRADRFLGFPEASAHCDIPCKIYDPALAIISALSVVRLIDIITEANAAENRESIQLQNTISRCIQRKEEESEKLKQEIRIIWGDYFKEPQIKKFPDIHQIAHEIMITASATKQNVDREKACLLLESVNKFSEIFWATKDINTERKQAPYPPHLEIVRPK